MLQSCRKSPGSRLGYLAGGLLVCAPLGAAVVASADLALNYRLALFAGFAGLALFAALPEKRLLLVVAWILIHPLSIEKVFMLGRPLLPDFLPPTLVVSASDLVLLLLATTLLAEGVMRPGTVWRWSPPMTPMAALTVWTVVCFAIGSPSLTSALVVVSGIKMFVFLLCLLAAIRTREDVLTVLAAILVAVGVQCAVVADSYLSARVISFSSKLTGGLLGFSGAQGQEYVRATGTLGHTNQEAAYLTFFAAPLIGILTAANRLWKTAALLVLGATALALIFTFSRSAWLAASLALLALLIWAMKTRQLTPKRSVLLLPAIGVGLLLCLVYGQRIAARLVYGDEGATASRERAIALAVDLAAEHPLVGVGPGNFIAASLNSYPPNRYRNFWLSPRESAEPNRYNYGRIEINQVFLKDGQHFTVPLPVHNKFLLTLVELGGVGLGLFLWFYWRIFRAARACLRAPDRLLLWAGLGCMAGFWAILVYMNLDLFADDKTMEILLFVPALIMPLQALASQARQEETQP